ncbi:hypothetical protein T265_06156 [Opisthorchis viverrini]|uniref:Uncharacterized protein n=1 Tax=Opisthorchis viverrini TaxID=6198 RepID=A0A074ZTH4_OPIVI|nr:hypothetical protein T265_06156 [Opisthorchis viverrini]KER26655.1 hypothetical protein T265_06156 [Opisthorchis viverrini]
MTGIPSLRMLLAPSKCKNHASRPIGCPNDESLLLDWIQVNSRLWVVRLSGSIRINAGRRGTCCVFATSPNVPVDCTSETEKDLSRLLRSA